MPLCARLVLLSIVLMFALVPIAPVMADSYQCGEPFGPACPPVPLQPYDGAGQVYGLNYLQLGVLDTPAYGVSRNTILNKVVDSGATYVRTEIGWRFGEPSAPTIDATTGQMIHTYDDVAIRQAEHDDLQARGIKQIMILSGTPYWALNSYDQGGTAPAAGQCGSNSNGHCYAPPNVDNINTTIDIKAAWQAWVKHVLDTYPNIAAIEIWNEPNNPPFWGTRQDASLYARILAAAADAAHAARPGIPVLIGGLAILGSNTNHGPYLDEVYNEPSLRTGTGEYKFDAIGFHGYPCNERYSSPAPYAGYLNLWLTATRNVRDSHGDGGKPIWVTETGVTSANAGPYCKFNEIEQRLALAYTLDWFKQQNAVYQDIPVVVVHNLFNRQGRLLLGLNTGNNETEYGLIAWSKNLLSGNVTTKLKPAYATVRCKFRGGC